MVRKDDCRSLMQGRSLSLACSSDHRPALPQLQNNAQMARKGTEPIASSYHANLFIVSWVAWVDSSETVSDLFQNIICPLRAFTGAQPRTMMRSVVVLVLPVPSGTFSMMLYSPADRPGSSAVWPIPKDLRPCSTHSPSPTEVMP